MGTAPRRSRELCMGTTRPRLPRPVEKGAGGVRAKSPALEFYSEGWCIGSRNGMALPPPKIGRPESSEVHRSGTSIYRKKIDTQKVYRGCPAQTLGDDLGAPSCRWTHFGPHRCKSPKKSVKKRTAPSVPKWSPTSVLTGPDQA